MRLTTLMLSLTLCIGAVSLRVAPASAEPVRRDPAGKTGISPFWEALVRGDAAHVAGDVSGAIAAYRTAILASPKDPLGHYRLGQAHVTSGALAEAREAYATALGCADRDPSLKAKILFVLADLDEREKRGEAALKAYDVLLQHLRAHTDIKASPAESVAERKQKITAYAKLAREVAAVRERIATRLREAETAARSSAEQNKNRK
jgi:tetratricopeptide (TPR) repeat protein